MQYNEIKGNKGEWSEFYTFIRILVDRVIVPADENLKKISDKTSEVLKVIREDSKDGPKTYDISQNNEIIDILNSKGDILDSVDSKNIKNCINTIFERMKIGGKSAFVIPEAYSLVSQLKCTQIKASSSKKTDLTLVIHDRISETYPELGYSIKSMLGSPSTLLNASGATNFVYRVDNVEDKKIEKINQIQGHSKLRDKSKEIYGDKGSLVFEKIENPKFVNNLAMIDLMFPNILAELLKIYYEGKASKINDLVELLSQDQNFCSKYGLNKTILEFKVKNFLINVALGMTPNTIWDGFTKAHGGYIIVKENGEIVCYHLYNRDEFQKYLYINTKFDTPSTTRHKFGQIYTENDKKYMKLNLQIRFIK